MYYTSLDANGPMTPIIPGLCAHTVPMLVNLLLAVVLTFAIAGQFS